MHALVQPQIEPLAELPELAELAPLAPLVEKAQLFKKAEQTDQAVPTTHHDETVHEVAYQSWTKDNLWVLSEHEETQYYTTRWDALCPYIEVTPAMIEMAPKPFVVYAVPPKTNLACRLKTAMA